MESKTIVISGSTSGIGKYTTWKLAGDGHTLVLIARSQVKVRELTEDLKKKTGNNNIEYYICDLSVMSEVKECGEKISRKYPVIDVLINCAGMIFPRREESADGYEMTFALNHLGYFMLTKMLLPSLKAASSARIVNVASEAQKAGSIHFKDINLAHGYSSFKAYSQSKLANIMFTYELARRLDGTGVTVNAVHPGTVHTGFGRDFKGLWRILFALYKPFMRDAEKGAETVIWLASSPEPEGITGRYFYDKKQIRSKAISYDQNATIRLWELSEQMTSEAIRVSEKVAG